LNLSENLGNSFDYAKKMLSDIGTLIVLIVLDVIPVVNWIVIGYGARVLRETPGSDVPPKLEKYGEMFVDGAKIFFAALVYMLIPAILIGAGVASFSAGGLLQGGMVGPGALVFGGTGLVLVMVGAILAFFFLLVLSIGMAYMVRTGKFGNAFAFTEIFGAIRGIGWVNYLGWAIVVFIIAVVIGGITGAIPYLGWLISAIISPALTVFIFRSLGLLYSQSAQSELMGQRIPSSGSGTVCTSCGTQLQPHQKFCPSCGAAAPALPPTTAAPKFCTSCGAKMPDGVTFCGSCGAKQN
jgi:hypothetical protein